MSLISPAKCVMKLKSNSQQRSTAVSFAAKPPAKKIKTGNLPSQDQLQKCAELAI